MAGLTGADGQPDGQVGFAGAGRAEEDDVVSGGDEVEGAQMGDGVAFERGSCLAARACPNPTGGWIGGN